MLRIGLLIILINLGQWGFLFCPCYTQHFLPCQNDGVQGHDLGNGQSPCCPSLPAQNDSGHFPNPSTPCSDCPCHSRTEHSSLPVSRTLQTRLRARRVIKRYCVRRDIQKAELAYQSLTALLRFKQNAPSPIKSAQPHLVSRLRC